MPEESEDRLFRKLKQEPFEKVNGEAMEPAREWMRAHAEVYRELHPDDPYLIKIRKRIQNLEEKALEENGWEEDEYYKELTRRCDEDFRDK
jgi:hypothetical protein